MHLPKGPWTDPTKIGTAAKGGQHREKRAENPNHGKKIFTRHNEAITTNHCGKPRKSIG
jgi:hypothetical protein